MTFPCRHYFQADSKQPYSHTVKLPDHRFRQIRFSGVSQISGSVPRRGNKQSGVCRCAASGHPGQDKTQHMVCRLDGKATATTIYGLRRPLRAGGEEEDPEPGVFGSDHENTSSGCPSRPRSWDGVPCTAGKLTVILSSGLQLCGRRPATDY